MTRQSVTKAQQPKNSTFLPPTDILQRKTINRTDFEASTVEARSLSGQQIDKPGLPGAETHFSYDFSRIPVTLNSPHLIQAKLRIGQPDDKYEQEADRVAEQVMSMPEPRLQRRAEEEEELIQTKPLAEQVTPLVQRQLEEEEEEELIQPKLEAYAHDFIQRQAEGEQEEFLQTKPLSDQITPLVQRQIEEEEEEEEEELQMKPLSNQIRHLVQRQVEEEEEEPLQTESVEDATPAVTHDLESRINAIRGGSQPLAESERAFFEPRFGYDFSRVRVHTDAQAAESARMVNARAFTIGQNIFFRQGEYNMSSRTGQELIAHELTHVVQQNGNSYVNSHKSDSKSLTSLSRCGIAPLSEGKSMRSIQRDIDLEEAFQEIPERDRGAFRSGAHALSRFRAVITDYSDFENVALSYGLIPHELLTIFMQEGGLQEVQGDLPYTPPPAIVRGNQRALVAFHLWVAHGMDDFARTHRKGSQECRDQGYPPTDNCPNWGALGSALLHQLRELHVRGLLWNVHGLRPRIPADQLDPRAIEVQLTSQIRSDGLPTPNFVRLAYRIVAASVTMRRMPAHRGRGELQQLGFSETEISGEEVEERLPSLPEEQAITRSTGVLPPEVEALFHEGEIFGEETISADEVVARYRRFGFRYRGLERAQEQLRIAQRRGNADAVRQAQDAIYDLMRRAFVQRMPVAVARFSMGTFEGYIRALRVVNRQFQRWNSRTNRQNRGAMHIWALDMRVLMMTRRPENEQHLLDEIRSSVTEQAVPQERLRTVLRRFVEGLIAMQDFDGLERLFRFIIDQVGGHAHISNTQDWIVALTESPPNPEGIPPSLYSQLVPVTGLSAIPRQIRRSIRRYGAYSRFSEVLIRARLEQEGEHP